MQRFGSAGHVCTDIEKFLDWALVGDEDAVPDAAKVPIPEFDLLVGGFPCQSYSVARTLNQAAGLAGDKGVLWWQIHRLVAARRPRALLLENVDRLLKSPASQRGRDFAVMLACLGDLGYIVEWRVVNAADLGLPQRRRRTFIYAWRQSRWPPAARTILQSGVLARALPSNSSAEPIEHVLAGDLADISDRFGHGRAVTPWRNAGVLIGRSVWTTDVLPQASKRTTTLGDVLLDESDIPDEFFVTSAELDDWRYLKGTKREPRMDAKTGHRYFYSEGAVAFPEPLDQPARTILTGEGGRSASRFKLVVATPSGRFRRLTPVELERLNGFPDGWTDTGMSDGQRAFCMGNALVVDVVRRIAAEIAYDLRPTPKRRRNPLVEAAALS